METPEYDVTREYFIAMERWEMVRYVCRIFGGTVPPKPIVVDGRVVTNTNRPRKRKQSPYGRRPKRPKGSF